MDEIYLFIIWLTLVGILCTLFAQMKRTKTTYLGAAKEFKIDKDITTVLPLSIHAATCSHDWEVVSEQILELPHQKKSVLVLSCRRCGTLDKTVQMTNPEPKYEPEPCSHEWDTAINESLELAHEKKLIVILTCRKCGVVDKTTETTSKSPWTKDQCQHKWETEKRVVLDSAYEQMLKSITAKEAYGKTKVDQNKKIELDLDTAPSWMFKKTYISVKVCKVCGEVDKTVAANFDAVDQEEVEA